MPTEERVIDRAGGLGTMLRAALPAVPGVNLIPGIGRHGDVLPDLVLRREDVAIERADVATYAAVCGFEPHETVPLTYPHLISFGLQMALMTDPAFPFPAIGTVHVANTITRLRPVSFADRLTAAVHAENLRPHPRGRLFDVLTTMTDAGGEPVWESTSQYLRLGRGEPDAPRSPGQEGPAGNGVVWRLPADLGRRYAAVSGDRNPIHLYPLTAKAFGFRRQIAHGMWSKARCVAAIANRLPDRVRVDVEFKKPVFLPGQVELGTRIESDGIAFSLRRPGTEVVHLVGRTHG